jgi:hypothetical protein
MLDIALEVPNVDLDFDDLNFKLPECERMHIARIEFLGLHIVAQCPSGEIILDILASIANNHDMAPPCRRAQAGSNWRQPEAPYNRLLSHRYPYGVVNIIKPLIWTAICLQSSALCQYLHMGPYEFLYWFNYSADSFMETLNFDLHIVFGERKKVGAGFDPNPLQLPRFMALSSICCLMFAAERNFGSFTTFIENTPSFEKIKNDKLRQLRSFCEHYCHKLQQQTPPAIKKIADLYRSATLELAQMDLSEWRNPCTTRYDHQDKDDLNFMLKMMRNDIISLTANRRGLENGKFPNILLKPYKIGK